MKNVKFRGKKRRISRKSADQKIPWHTAARGKLWALVMILSDMIPIRCGQLCYSMLRYVK